MDKILVGQAHSTKITTKTDKKYLVVGLPAKDRFLCRDEATRDYVTIDKNEIESVRTKREEPPMVARVF